MAHFTILTRTLTKKTEWGGFNPAGVKFCQLRMSLFKCHVQNYLFNFYIIPKKCWRTVSKIMWIEEWRRIEGKETGKNRTNIVPETTAFKFRNKISKGTTLQDTEPRQLPTADCKFSRRYILTGGSWLKPVSWKVAEYLDMPNCSTANGRNRDVTGFDRHVRTRFGASFASVLTRACHKTPIYQWKRDGFMPFTSSELTVTNTAEICVMPWTST